MYGQKEGPNTFQTFSTLLALLLPALQFFFNFLPDQARNIFLIQGNFFVVSAIAGTFAYLLIIAFKNTYYFQFTLNRKQEKRWRKFQKVIDPNIYSEDEIRDNYKEHRADPPFYLTPANIYYALIPIVFVCMVSFLALGLFFKGSQEQWVIFVQSVIYILLVSMTSLTLAIFYINDTNRRKREQTDREKFERVKQLLFVNRGLDEFPLIKFYGQAQVQEADGFKLYTVIDVNGTSRYKITTDPEANVLELIEDITPRQYPTNEGNDDEDNR